MEKHHEKCSARHIALCRTRARPGRLSTRNEHVDSPQYAADRDAEVVAFVAGVAFVAAAFVDESIDISRVAWNEFVDGARRAAEGRQVADRCVG